MSHYLDLGTENSPLYLSIKESMNNLNNLSPLEKILKKENIPLREQDLIKHYKAEYKTYNLNDPNNPRSKYPLMTHFLRTCIKEYIQEGEKKGYKGEKLKKYVQKKLKKKHKEMQKMKKRK